MNRSFGQFRFFTLLRVMLFLGALLPGLCAAQQPPPPTPPAPESAPQAPAPAQENSKKQQSKIPPFLILGTVFTERNYAFPGVAVRIRRKGEKKYRFGAYTDSRGEFAIRVPEGIEYEVVVAQKKYKEQSQEVAAKMEEVQKRLTFKMEPIVAAKSGDAK